MDDGLFRALLAMDSYNRGNNAGVNIAGSTIGNATIGASDQSTSAQSASFFAQAYTWNGKTIISYRGSDGLAPAWLPFGWGGAVPSDIPAWSIWFANAYSTDQAELAASFYQQVKATTTGPIETTGHSLGGALAGLVAATYGLEGKLWVMLSAAARWHYARACEVPCR